MRISTTSRVSFVTAPAALGEDVVEGVALEVEDKQVAAHHAIMDPLGAVCAHEVLVPCLLALRIPAGMGSLLTSPTSGKGLKGSTQSLQVPKENATTKASRKASRQIPRHKRLHKAILTFDSSRPGAEDFEALAGNITNSLPKTNPPRAKEARPPAVQNPTR